MSDFARRPEDQTPHAERRTIRDDWGRSWVGTVTSGHLPGGEEHAEVSWICVDAPSETKLVTRLDAPAATVDEHWRSMSTDDVAQAFRRSEPA